MSLEATREEMASEGGIPSPEDMARAGIYDLLAALLHRPPSAEALARIAGLQPGEGEIGRAVKSLAGMARVMDPESIEREHTALFIGLGRGELVPYASYYRTGFLNEKPLADLRADMARLGITRAPEVMEPEDGIASLCEMMAGLILGRFGEPASLAVQNEFFRAHLEPWARHFFSDLEKASSAAFYAPVGALGRAMMEIEAEMFRMIGEGAPIGPVAGTA